jgi:glycosyltransferase involved in cell wall biosynthesis
MTPACPFEVVKLMKIYLFGQRNNLGGGTHFGGFVDAMKSLAVIGERVEEVEVSGKKISPVFSQIQPSDVSVFFFPTLSEQFVKGTIVKWGIFETDKLPDEYISYLKRSHLIWVPSQWAKAVLTAHGLDGDHIHIVHEGVNPDIYHPYCRPQSSASHIFRFFMCGKKETRKGFDELLEGFKIAFGGDQTTELHLKADYFWGGQTQADAKQDELSRQIDGLGLTNVMPVSGALSTSDMALLYSNYDAMVFPSRAEGWGLPLIEAIACGLPVISTFYSGHAEYLDAIDGQFVRLDYQLQPISCPEFLQHWRAGGQWAVASPEEIATKLVFLKTHYNSFQQHAMAASQTIRDHFSWRHAAEQAVASLRSAGVFQWQNIFSKQLANMADPKIAS